MLFPGTVREEEMHYYAHVLAVKMKVKNEPVPSLAELGTMAPKIGYKILQQAMIGSLNMLQLPLWSVEQYRSLESFVLQGLDVIPRTAGIPADLIADESNLVATIEKNFFSNNNPRNYAPAFCAAVVHKWRSNAVRSVLRAHGVLQTGNARAEQVAAKFDALRRADIAKHGLRDCALPSCDKTERTVKEFAGCTGCRSVVYCCLEHQALDWRAHKKACREKEAARLAAVEAENDEEGAGASAA